MCGFAIGLQYGNCWHEIHHKSWYLGSKDVKLDHKYYPTSKRCGRGIEKEEG